MNSVYCSNKIARRCGRGRPSKVIRVCSILVYTVVTGIAYIVKVCCPSSSITQRARERERETQVHRASIDRNNEALEHKIRDYLVDLSMYRKQHKWKTREPTPVSVITIGVALRCLSLGKRGSEQQTTFYYCFIVNNKSISRQITKPTSGYTQHRDMKNIIDK